MNPRDGLGRPEDPNERDVHLRARWGAFVAKPRSRGRMAGFAILSVAAAAVVLGAASLAVVAFQTHNTATMPTESNNSTSSNSPAEPLAPSVTADYDGPATCNNLLDDATVTEFTSAGWADVSEDYREKVIAGSDPTYADVINYGGILCAWGPAHGSFVTSIYGFGPISQEQMEDQRDSALGYGAVLSEADGYDLYTYPVSPDSDYEAGGVIFGNGTWAFATDWGGGNVIDDLIEHSPR